MQYLKIQDISVIVNWSVSLEKSQVFFSKQQKTQFLQPCLSHIKTEKLIHIFVLLNINNIFSLVIHSEHKVLMHLSEPMQVDWSMKSKDCSHKAGVSLKQEAGSVTVFSEMHQCH